MFALNEKKTFEAVPTWLAEFRKHIPESNIPIALAGNKKDLEKERQVSTEEAKNFATEKNMSYFETSAKLGGEEIEQIFHNLAQDALNKRNTS